MPETASDARESVDQFDDGIFDVTLTTANVNHSRYHVAVSIKRVRPVTVPIERSATFDVVTLDETGALMRNYS